MLCGRTQHAGLGGLQKWTYGCCSSICLPGLQVVAEAAGCLDRQWNTVVMVCRGGWVGGWGWGWGGGTATAAHITASQRQCGVARRRLCSEYIVENISGLHAGRGCRHFHLYRCASVRCMVLLDRNSDIAEEYIAVRGYIYV